MGKNNITTLTKGSDNYPSNYQAEDATSENIYAVGNVNLLSNNSKRVAIWGNSHPSEVLLDQGKTALQDYLNHGYAVVILMRNKYSFECLKVALQLGGKVIAVACTYINKVADTKLVDAIIEHGGLLISLTRTEEDDVHHRCTMSLLGSITTEHYLLYADSFDWRYVIRTARHYNSAIKYNVVTVSSTAIRVLDAMTNIRAKTNDATSNKKNVLILTDNINEIVDYTEGVLCTDEDIDINTLHFIYYYDVDDIAKTIIALHPDVIVADPNDLNIHTMLIKLWAHYPELKQMKYFFFPNCYRLDEKTKRALISGDNRYEYQSSLGEQLKQII